MERKRVGLLFSARVRWVCEQRSAWWKSSERGERKGEGSRRVEAGLSFIVILPDVRMRKEEASTTHIPIEANEREKGLVHGVTQGRGQLDATGTMVARESKRGDV